MENCKICKRKVPIENNKQAVFTYGKYGFPCELYKDNIDDFQNNTVNLHWQHELEFSIIRQGCLELQVQNHTAMIQEGQGYIVFPNKLHQIKKAGKRKGIYNTVILDPKILYGDSTSILFHKYYLPVLNRISKGYILLCKSDLKQKEILIKINKIISILEALHDDYELQIHRLLLSIWSDICTIISTIQSDTKLIAKQDKILIEKIQLFIHTNFSQNLTLADIAKSGSVSKSECSRLFQRTLGCTPFEYLNRYKVTRSQEYLAGTSYSISDVANLVGFNSASYYATVFKKYVGYTPQEYQKLLFRL